MITYEVRVVQPADGSATYVTTEADALAAAERLVNQPRVEQVTIEATPNPWVLDTFAVRHVKPTGSGRVDTGEWSCWVDGMFTGVRATLEGWPT